MGTFQPALTMRICSLIQMTRYSSTDAVRKHCRKRHLEWLRKLDLMAAHDRYLPKPALYCRWGSETEIL